MVLLVEKFTETKYLQISVIVDEYVFWFQVAVDEIQVMQVLERQHDLSRVKLSVIFSVTVIQKNVKVRNFSEVYDLAKQSTFDKFLA